MIPEFKQALEEFALAMGDDHDALGRRNEEAAGRTLDIENEVVLLGIAYDQLAVARSWRQLLAGLLGQDPDRQAEAPIVARPVAAWRCAQLVELPCGDWAFTATRQFLFGAWSAAWSRLASLSALPGIAGVATQMQADADGQLRTAGRWLRRGAAEDRVRAQGALLALWPYTAQLFEATELDRWLIDAGAIPDPRVVRAAWLEYVSPRLGRAGLTIPVAAPIAYDRETHTPYLAEVVEGQ